MKGKIKTIQPELSEDFNTVMQWADDIRRLKVRTNSETPEDTKTALKFGAEGIGLCRTEHMFFDPARILNVREMILAENKEDRCKALQKLEPVQEQDFIELFEIMQGLPVTIRLLDPPLHEFLPHGDEEIIALSKSLDITTDAIKSRINRLHESNPMLGHRGCRLAITYPEIYEMQARAIFKAASKVIKSTGNKVAPEVMVPLIMSAEELSIIKTLISKIAVEVMDSENIEIEYSIGTMIEIPRAAIMAKDIATEAEFFSFGTNDLTQTTLGISRDDSGMFLPSYQEKHIFEKDPFASIDTNGVGELIKTAIKRGQSSRPNIKLGVCGEHGGDPESIKFFEAIGLDYISCSPYRIPIAKLSAAQAKLLSLDVVE